ncbi:MAG: CDP-alcohol phosphatidyltransferase family protein, partial [Akkermansia sp.]
MMKKLIVPDEPMIPLLPNLFTAGNLLCGFFAILTILQGMIAGTQEAGYNFTSAYGAYQQATYFIFASCIFDLLDGRVARMSGQEGPFGREFDSLADIVSFGIAPALL